VVVRPQVPGDYYHVYIKYSEARVSTVMPSEENFDYSFTLPNNKTFKNDYTGELPHTAFIANNETKGNGTYYIAVKLAG
jgi:hypothetical protein